MKFFFYIIFFLIFISCGGENNEDLFFLKPTDTYRNFFIDDETRIPKFSLWTFSVNGKEYLTFSNRGCEILFYDIEEQNLIKRVKYEKEGNNGVGYIMNHYVIDFDNIYIADSSHPILYVTDSVGNINSKIPYEKDNLGNRLVPACFYTIVYSPMILNHNNIYFIQDANIQLGDDFLEKSPLGIKINIENDAKTVTPLKYSEVTQWKKHYRNATGGTQVSFCFDGEDLIYSPETTDSIYKLSWDFSTMKRYSAKSRYIKHPKIEIITDENLDKILKRKCELPAYGNLIYDKYRDVYYRLKQHK